MDKTKRLDKLLETTLFEQPEEPEQEEPDTTKEKPKEVEADKDQDVKKKDLADVDKKDLDDEEDEEEANDEDVVVSVKLNDNVEKGGQIKLVNSKKLTGLNSIESILKLFKIDPENVSPDFKDKIELTINSPLQDFKEHEYVLTLMDKIGQLSISRPDFKTTITKKSKGNLQQAVQQGVGEAPAEGEEATKPEEQIDLSYLPELDSEFLRAVKNEFFDRILERR